MRELSPGLQAHLDQDVTTLCRVFILSLSDGRRFAVSDHDRPMLFEGLTARPMAAAETELRSGFDADSGAVRMAFDLELEREAVLAGALDGATLAEYRVNWAEPDQSVHLTTGRIGGVTVSDTGFEAEWLGLSTVLDRSTGRVFSRRCDAEYGDARCGVSAQPGESCARTLEACRAHGNVLNFRGFPFLIGDDALQQPQSSTPVRDGGSRYG